MEKTERQRKIESYGRAYELLAEAAALIPREAWQWRGQRDPWTIHEVIVHITDSEANSFIRCRKCIAEPGSLVVGYDENLWPKALHYHDRSAEDAMALFRLLRASTYHLIRDLPDEVWSHTVQHSESGAMTLEDWLTIYDDHVPAHVRQMQAIYEEWQQMKDAG